MTCRVTQEVISPLFRNRTETDRQTIPAVDGNNGERQVNQFFLAKLLVYHCIRLVWYVVKGNQGNRFGPRQGCLLTLGIEWCLTPGN